MPMDPKRVLVVYDYHDSPEKMRQTILHHLQALESSEAGHHLVYYNASEAAQYLSRGSASAREVLRPLWGRFDAVILHYSFLGFRGIGDYFYEWEEMFRWIRDLDCVKIAIPQDEADHAALLDEWLFDLGVTGVLSVHYQPEGPLYPIMRGQARFYPCLPGYVDRGTVAQYRTHLTPIAQRPLDLIYRARHLPYWYGRAGQLKHRIAEMVLPRASAKGYRCDISTRPEDVIFGSAWFDFLASSRAVIGCEGGSSVIDWRGESKATVKAMLKAAPTLSFEQVRTRMPDGWDEHRLFTITPRQFEAAMTKTCLVLVEGRYKGVLTPSVHYIPLKQDCSNLDDVLELLRDDRYVQAMVDRVYQDICVSERYTYGAMADLIERAMTENGHRLVH